MKKYRDGATLARHAQKVSAKQQAGWSWRSNAVASNAVAGGASRGELN
jgi:hypothetical protein